MGTALENLREFFKKRGVSLDKKSTTSLLVLLVMVLLLPVGIFLVKQQLNFLPRAAGQYIQLGEGGCIKLTKDKNKVVDCPKVPLKLINPFFRVSSGSARPSVLPSSSSTSSASPSASSSPAGSVGPAQNVTVRNFNNDIQAALDSIRASGGSVYVPAGTYLIPEKIRLYSNTTLFGDGMGATIIKLSDQALNQELAANDSSNGQQNVVIRDLTLQGPNIPRITDCCHGLKLENLDGGYVINVEVKDVGMDGIYLGYKHKNGVPQGVKNVRVTGCKVSGSQRQQIGYISGNNVVIDHCTIDGTKTHGQQVYVGIDLEPDDETTIVENSYVIANNVSNTNIGIALNGTNGESKNAATVRNNKVCANTVNAISINISDSGQNNQVTDANCEIPANLANLPPAPAKPAAERENLIAKIMDSVITPAVAQDSDDQFDTSGNDSDDQFNNSGNDSDDEFAGNEVGNGDPRDAVFGGDSLLYRLAETQAGLSQAQWKEFALVPNSTNLARKDNYSSSSNQGWFKSLLSSLTQTVSAQNTAVPNGCKRITPVKRFVKYKNCQNAGEACANETSLAESSGENDVDENYKFPPGSGPVVASYPLKESVWEFSDGWKNFNMKGPRLPDGDRTKISDPRFESPGGAQKYAEKSTGQTVGDGAVRVVYGNGEVVEFAYNKPGKNYQGVDKPGTMVYDPSRSYAYVPTDPNSNTRCDGSAGGNNNNGGNNGNGGNNNGGGGNNNGGGGGNAGGGGGSGAGGGGGAGSGGSGSGGSGSGGSGSGGSGSGGSGGGGGSGQGPTSSGTPTFSIGKEFINTTFDLSDATPGTKQIWVQYLHPDGSTVVDNIQFQLVEKSPKILGLACNLDISKENLRITIDGEHFGDAIGTVETTAPSNLKPEVLGWNNKQITAFLKKPNIPINEGTRFRIKLTRPDGFESGTAVCAVDKSLISLGARIFCREPGQFDAKDVSVTLLYDAGDPASPEKISKIEEKLSINADGEIENLKTRLQTEKSYAISIKAPYSLRRNATFTASEGTTEILAPDGGEFILPVGDIAPRVRPDGAINTLDRAELIRQWRILGQGNIEQTGDFNQDDRVNSIDWACMHYDFGKVDDPIPVSVPRSASGSLNIPGAEGGNSATITIPPSSSNPNPSVLGSPSPIPSPSADTSNSARIDVAGKLFLDTNRNGIVDPGESFIGLGAGTIKLLQVPEDHVLNEPLTAEELAESRILAEVRNNLPGANYDISVFVEKDSGGKFAVMATANNGELSGTIDFALETPLVNTSRVINIPVTSVTR